jgi:hypothetical protein
VKNTNGLKSALCAVAMALAISGCNSFEDPNAVDGSSDASAQQDSGSDTQDTAAAPDAGTDSSDSQGTDVMAPDVGTQDLGNQDTAAPDAATDTGPAPECVVAVDCNDNNPCTTDYCDVGKCQHTAAAGNCDDNNPCTDNDICNAGACKGTELVCNDNNPCTDDFCMKGKCFQGVNNALCDDNNACTQNDKCSGGSCQGGAAKDCNDNNLCTTDTCDSLKGCMSAPVICEDNDACTTDTCESKTGACAFVSLNCDDGKAWSYDYCDGEGWYNNIPGQCVHEQKWNACQKDSDCTDDDPCTVDVCDSFNGQCVNITQQCSDNNPCTFADTCVGGGCYGMAKNCNDYEANTADSCDKVSGACVHTPISTPPVVVPPTSGTTVKVEISCGAVACEVHPYFGADAGGKSFDNMGPASANGWYTTDLPKAQLCVWGMEVAARLSSMPSLPWFGCDVGAPSLNTVTVKVNGVVQSGVLTTHPWVCQGGGEGNKKYLPAAFGCP